MLFSSMIFLWGFLPLTLLSYYIVKPKYKNILLLIASLIFYAWGEPVYILLMIFTITINYVAGIILDRLSRGRKWVLFLSVVINLGLLFYYKYFDLLVSTINKISGNSNLELRDIALPIGISFYTFQAMSYVIDLYKGEIKAQKSWFKLALYISFFPQLIAGPIVRYVDICNQIENRVETIDKFAYGIKRFSYGLGKKVILANSMASIVDNIMKLDMAYIGTGLSWTMAICYTLQIYYDFSGYSDMAIGLGKMFGFDIGENFNYPYISGSIQEFWRRWHISLSSWFKEYVYIPLGGNRKGFIRTLINLSIVFFVTGMWHGAAYTFIIWGLYHGFFSILERLFLGKVLEKNPIKLLNHVYALLVVVVGWVLFRADDIIQALKLIKRMFIYRANIGYNCFAFVGKREIIIIVSAVLLSFLPCVRKKQASSDDISIYSIVLSCLILVYCIILLICNTYNPFIYFRF